MTRRWFSRFVAVAAVTMLGVGVSPQLSYAAGNSPYVTMSNLNSGLTTCLVAASSTAVYPTPCNENQTAQQWMFVYIGTGGAADPRTFYQIKSRSSGKCLAPTTGGTPNAVVHLITCTSNWIDYWHPQGAGTFIFQLFNRLVLPNTANQCLVSHGTATGSGNLPWLWNCNAFYEDQQWTFKIVNVDDVWHP